MNIATDITVKSPSWLPPAIRSRLAEEKEIRYRIFLTRSEKRVLKKKRKIPPSEWAPKHRVVSMSLLAGKWKNETVPYAAEIMDAAMFPSVRSVALCAGPQSAKSEIVITLLGYCSVYDPGPALLVYPDEQTEKENFRDRITPMFQSSPQLRGLMTKSQDDVSVFRINLQHMPIYGAWATSPARTANKPIKILILEETDKYPKTVGLKEGDTISYIEKRTNTYRKHKREKVFKLSTPTVEKGPIWVALKESEVIFDRWVRCPNCGIYQYMAFDRIRVPENVRDPNAIRKDLLAWYECDHCRAKWDDHEKDKAVAMGQMRERVVTGSNRVGLEIFSYLRHFRPEKIGIHLPSWVSPFISLSDVMGDWFEAVKPVKNRAKLKAFVNAHKAEPWTDYTVEREEDKILALRDDRPRGLVPAGNLVSGITAAIDTHDDGFHYELRAWGWGMIQESWQIREGFVPSLEAMEKILWESVYRDAVGKEYVVQITLIDSQGHRTPEVYDWARLHRRRVIPIKGEQRMNQPHAWTKVDVYPGTSKPIPGGLKLLRINTNYYKDLLSSKLEVSPADPGAWHLHSEASGAWAAGMCVEFVNDKGFWECPEGKRNEPWDLGVYGLAAAELIGLKYRPKPDDHPSEKAQQERTVVKSKWMEK